MVEVTDKLFNEYAEKYNSIIKAMSHKFHVRGYTCDDFYQEFLTALYYCIQRFDATKGTPFQAYFFAAMYRAVHTLLKHQEPSSLSLDEFPETESNLTDDDPTLADVCLIDNNTPESVDSRDRKYQDLLALMKAELTAEQYDTVYYHAYGNMSFTEIADLCGITKQGARLRYTSGVKKLREKLGVK